MKYFLLFFVLVISGCENLLYQKVYDPLFLTLGHVYLGAPTPTQLKNKPIKEVRLYLYYKSKITYKEQQTEWFKMQYNKCLTSNSEKEDIHEYCDIEFKKKIEFYLMFNPTVMS